METQSRTDIEEHYGRDAFEKYGVGTYRIYGLNSFIDLAHFRFKLQVEEGFDSISNSRLKIFKLIK